MAMFKRVGGAVGSGVNSTVSTVVVFFLAAYFFANVGMQLAETFTNFAIFQEEECHANNMQVQKLEGCDKIEDYIEDGNYDDKSTENPWRQMKWGLPPAKCPVNGHLIERLDPSYNYRRGVALRFTDDLDDKTHIEHWFLGTVVNFNLRKRRVFIDLGANNFHTSVVWFNQRYPCDFTEVHAFETDSNLFQLPEGFQEETNSVDQPGWNKLKGRDGWLPTWMISRVHSYNKYAGDVDDEAANAVNITRFIKDELKLTEQDAVIVKMDIEGAEWPILKRWVNDPEMSKIVDELWVELHYLHPDNGWEFMRDHTREESTRLLGELRFKGFYAHYWD